MLRFGRGLKMRLNDAIECLQAKGDLNKFIQELEDSSQFDAVVYKWLKELKKLRAEKNALDSALFGLGESVANELTKAIKDA
jgi:hypothetical protein